MYFLILSFNGMLVNPQGISLQDILVMAICLTYTLATKIQQARLLLD